MSAVPRRVRVALVACATCFASLCLSAAISRAQSPSTAHVTITPKARIDAAQLQTMSRSAATAKLQHIGWDEFEPNMPDSPQPLPSFAPPASPANDPAPPSTQSFAYTYALRRSFHGNRMDGGYPMDPHMAAGPNHIVVMTNLHIVWYSKQGDSLGAATLSDFFQPGSATPNVFDPRVVFDPGSGRFIAICLSIGSTPASAWQIAISKGSDPTLGWTLYEFSSLLDGQGIDYPYLGFGAGAVYLSGNYRDTYFGWPNGSPTHASGVWVLDKAAMLAAGPVTTWWLIDLPGESEFSTPEPCARWSTPPSGLDDFLSTFENTGSGSWRALIWGVTLPSGWPAAPPILDRRSYTTLAPPLVPNAPQLGGPALLSANNIGSPASMYYFMNGHIHTALHVPSGGGILVRHYDENVSGWPSVSGTTEDYWDGSSFHYYPAVAVSPWGDVGLVYSRSSTTEYSGAFWTVKPQDDFGYQSSQTLKAGERYYGNPPDTPTTLYRWGDYAGAAPDPVTGGLWFINMFTSTSGTGTATQGTWIGYVPHAVFVDASWFFIHTGSRTYPWAQFLDGYNAAWNENDLVLKAGGYHAGSGVLTKPLTIKSDGGTATITP